MLTKEKWTMLLTRNCTVPVPNPPSVEWIESAKVNLSLHHAVSHKAISFKAIAGCFRPGHVLLFWLIPSEANGLMEWKVTAVDLEEMLKFSTARQTAQYIPPMEFEDLGVSASPDNNKLPIMWSLTLGHEDKSQPFNAASTLLFPLVIADRLFVFTQSASVYLATLPSATVSSAKLNGKCSLPLLGGDQFSKTVLGVLTDSNAPTSNPSVLCLGMTADESSQRIFSIIRVNLKDIAVRIKSNAVPGK